MAASAPVAHARICHDQALRGPVNDLAVHIRGRSILLDDAQDRLLAPVLDLGVEPAARLGVLDGYCAVRQSRPPAAPGQPTSLITAVISMAAQVAYGLTQPCISHKAGNWTDSDVENHNEGRQPRWPRWTSAAATVVRWCPYRPSSSIEASCSLILAMYVCAKAMDRDRSGSSVLSS